MTTMVDPITLATTWHYIQRVCREMRYAVERTATNVLLVTLHDMAYGIWDAQGRVVAIPEGFPVRLISSTFPVNRVREKFETHKVEITAAWAVVGNGLPPVKSANDGAGKATGLALGDGDRVVLLGDSITDEAFFARLHCADVHLVHARPHGRIGIGLEPFRRLDDLAQVGASVRGFRGIRR